MQLKRERSASDAPLEESRSLGPTNEFFGSAPLPQEPLIFFRETDFWLQGVNFGVAVRF
jgi:hypothetical protein